MHSLDFSQNPICTLLGIKYPIIQAGMIWVSGSKLAAASSRAGILGIIGAASMNPSVLKIHLEKMHHQNITQFGVNLPLLYHGIQGQIDLCLDFGVKIFFTSAGSPRKWTPYLKKRGATVVHVTSSPELARKCEDSGCDALVCEGFEAGGHNGRDELTSMCLIPQVCDAVSLPVIAAGGFYDGRGFWAARALGALGVQMGSRFVLAKESSAHKNFKDEVAKAHSGDTKLALKRLVPVRLLKNNFFRQVENYEERGASEKELRTLLGKGRARAGMFEGDLEEGELEIGQICGAFSEVLSVHDIVKNLVSEIEREYHLLCEKNF